MSEKDVLDPDLRLRFAWRTAATLPEDPIEPAPPVLAPSRVEVRVGAEAESDRKESPAEACELLARRVAHIWQMTPRRRQVAATRHLFASLKPTDVGFGGMEKHPVEVTRLWRLGLRHARVLGADSRRILWRMPIALHVPEGVDFLVEVVESGDDALARLLEEGDVLRTVARIDPTLGPRLARVVEHGKTWAARRCAVRWIVRVDRRAAVEVLRRAIRRPLLPLRSCALNALLEMRPAALEAEDVAWLLDDAVKHPLPPVAGGDHRDARSAYEEALLHAVQACTPPEGWRPLVDLAEHRSVAIGPMRDGLGAEWALGVLAAAWPERAVPRIDRALADPTEHRRTAAIDAAALLPEALARLRLLDGATLPEHDAAERAKDRWFQRFGEACPVSSLAGMPVELLDGPPSDALLARLTVLRGTSAEAAGTVLGAALAEAPSREALVLLLYSLRHMWAAHEEAGLEGYGDVNVVIRLTSGLSVWANALLRRFGAPAFDGLLVLAAREAGAGVDRGWLDVLVSLARKGAFDEAQRARLRDLAVGSLGEDVGPTTRMACEVLGAVGAPASAVDRLWSIALYPYPPGAGPEDGVEARAALYALAATEGMSQIEVRFAQEAEVALASGAWQRLADLVVTGGRRGMAEVLAMAMRALVVAERDPAAAAIAEFCARTLLRAGLIGDKWLAAMLSRPSSPLFVVAAELVPPDAGSAIVRALARALDHHSHDGRAEAEAANALLVVEALAINDPRLDVILERAPEGPRLRLLRALLQRGAPLASVHRHCAALLLSRDERTAEGMFYQLDSAHRGTETWDLMESVLALGPAGAMRESIERYLGAPSEAEMYWRDLEGDDEPDPQG